MTWDKLNLAQEQLKPRGTTRLFYNQMISASELTSTTGRKNGDSYYYFVSKFTPFVCFINSTLLPFVCRNMPNSTCSLRARRGLGFTLIELVVTMAVAAILVAVAVPELRTFIQNNRLITQTNNLIGDLRFAQGRSLGHNSENGQQVNIGLCASTNGTACTGGTWRDGYLIFVDQNNNSAWDAGETVLRFREALVANNTVTAATILDPLIYIKGVAINPGALPRSITYCDNRGPTKGKQINLNNQGMPTTSSVPPGAC